MVKFQLTFSPSSFSLSVTVFLWAQYVTLKKHPGGCDLHLWGVLWDDKFGKGLENQLSIQKWQNAFAQNSEALADKMSDQNNWGEKEG